MVFNGMEYPKLPKLRQGACTAMTFFSADALVGIISGGALSQMDQIDGDNYIFDQRFIFITLFHGL